MAHDHGRTGPYPVDQPEASVGDLVGRLTDDFGSIVQSHVMLAKEEITAEIKKAGRGAGMTGRKRTSGLDRSAASSSPWLGDWPR